LFVGLLLPPGAVPTGELDEAGVRSLDGELEVLCASVDEVFARPASRENLRAMVRGLLSEVPRKNLWQLAEFAGHPNPDRLQGFLAKAAWDADELRDRVRDYAVATLAADDAVLIADETGDLKKGRKSAGVQRQYTGTAGRIDNAQVSVRLSYGSSRGRTLVDRELYLGKDWTGTTAEHERRCAEQGIPPERAMHVATRPELARRMLERALAAQVPFGYFLADEAYGQCRTLRAWLEEREVRYVLAVPKDEALPLPDGRTRQARELYVVVPEEAFERRSCADGAKGPRDYRPSAMPPGWCRGTGRHQRTVRGRAPRCAEGRSGGPRRRSRARSLLFWNEVDLALPAHLLRLGDGLMHLVERVLAPGGGLDDPLAHEVDDVLVQLLPFRSREPLQPVPEPVDLEDAAAGEDVPWVLADADRLARQRTVDQHAAVLVE
jgi:hypothetical protein